MPNLQQQFLEKLKKLRQEKKNDEVEKLLNDFILNYYNDSPNYNFFEVCRKNVKENEQEKLANNIIEKFSRVFANEDYNYSDFLSKKYSLREKDQFISRVITAEEKKREDETTSKLKTIFVSILKERYNNFTNQKDFDNFKKTFVSKEDFEELFVTKYKTKDINSLNITEESKKRASNFLDNIYSLEKEKNIVFQLHSYCDFVNKNFVNNAIDYLINADKKNFGILRMYKNNLNNLLVVARTAFEKYEQENPIKAKELEKTFFKDIMLKSFNYFTSDEDYKEFGKYFEAKEIYNDLVNGKDYSDYYLDADFQLKRNDGKQVSVADEEKEKNVGQIESNQLENNSSTQKSVDENIEKLVDDTDNSLKEENKIVDTKLYQINENDTIFMQKYKGLLKSIKENYGVLGLKENEKLLSDSFIASEMFSRYFKAVLNNKGAIDVLYGNLEIAKNNKKFAETLLESYLIVFKYSDLKDEFDKINEETKDKSSYEKLEAFTSYLNSDPKTDFKNKVIKGLLNNISTKFNIFISSEPEIIIHFYNGCKLDSNLEPNVDDLTSIFENIEKTTKPELDSEINELINAESEKGEPDEELIASLKFSNEILRNCEENVKELIGKVGESQGKISYKIFDNTEYNSYLNENNVKPISSCPSNMANDIINYYKENVKGEVKYSEKFSSTLKECVKTLINKNYVFGNNHTNNIFYDDGEELKSAIKRKDTLSIKKYSKIMSEKIKDIDDMILKLKGIDNKHLINENMSDCRSVFYPIKFRVDYEGNTLLNQALYIANICKKYKVDPDTMIDNPIETVRNIFKNSKIETSYKNEKGEKIENIFYKASVLTQEDGLMNSNNLNETKIINDFIQLAPCMSINNPENRAETYHKLSVELSTFVNARKSNFEKISEGIVKNDTMYNDALPKMIMMGDEFNPNLHLNVEGLIDFDTIEIRKEFKLNDYMKNLKFETMFNRFKNANTQLAEYNENYESNDKFQVCLNDLEENIRNVSRSKNLPNNVIDLKIKEAKGTKLTPMQNNLVNAAMDYYGNNDVKDNEKLFDKLKSIADLKKKYDSHNWIAKAIFPKLKAQKALISQMKQDLVSKNFNIEDIEKTIENINAKTITLDNFQGLRNSKTIDSNQEIQQNIDVKDLNNDERVSIEIDIENAVSNQKKKDERGFTIFNISDKMAELEELFVKYCSSFINNKDDKEYLKERILSFGVTEDEIEYVLDDYDPKNISKIYVNTSYVLSRIEKEFIIADRENDIHTINDLDFDDKPKLSNEEVKKRENDIDENLPIGALDKTVTQKVKYSGEANNSERDSQKEADFQRKLLVAGGFISSMDAANKMDSTAINELYNEHSRKEKNEMHKKLFNQERKANQNLNMDVPSLNEKGVEATKKYEEEIENDKNDKKARKVDIEIENKRLVEEALKEFKSNNQKYDEEESKQVFENYEKNGFYDSFANDFKFKRIANLAKLYEKDNPKITEDELLTRGKLLNSDELKWDSEISIGELKDIVDKRYLLYKDQKRKTRKPDEKIIEDILNPSKMLAKGKQNSQKAIINIEDDCLTNNDIKENININSNDENINSNDENIYEMTK